jgi:hypothetical protein
MSKQATRPLEQWEKNDIKSQKIKIPLRWSIALKTFGAVMGSMAISAMLVPYLALLFLLPAMPFRNMLLDAGLVQQHSITGLELVSWPGFLISGIFYFIICFIIGICFEIGEENQKTIHK